MIFAFTCGLGFGFLVGVILTADYIEKECGCHEANED
jgi:hypothetical protein